MAEENDQSPLVVVGSSAGGIDALSVLVSSLAPKFPAPIIIAQHLSPQHPSHLAEILSRRSPLPVRTILDHEALESGTIYVVPADRHVQIRNGHLSLTQEDGGRPKPSINLLFASAAQAYGEQLIAVILTGTGSDGATGAIQVKKAGGTVVIQNPATAQFASMPRSLAPTTVDFVANLEEIGSLLFDLLSGVLTLLEPNETKTLQNFLRQLHDRSGLDFSSYKRPTIQRRLQRRMVATGSTTISAYMRYLNQHPDEYNRLVSTFLIKVTEFFRDREIFAALRTQILPELIAKAQEQGSELRIWSAGCATGEEAYSLAILVADLLGDELDQFAVRIFATDLDNDAIMFARRGIYPAASLAGMPPELVARYFQKIDGDYEIQKWIRGQVIFGLHDLGQRAPFPRIDLVLCRNVLIYFTQELQRRVLQLFAYSLRDHGYLALGKAETISPLAEYFTPVHTSLKIYRRQGDRLLIPMSQIKDTTPLRPSSILPGRLLSASLPTFPLKEPSRHRTSLEKLGSLVFNLPIGVIVVDQRYDIQIINSLAHQLLGIHRSAIGEDLLHLAEGIPTKPLRALIDSIIRGETASRSEQILPVENETGEERYVQIVGYPQQLDGEDGPVASVLLLVTDITAQSPEQLQDDAPQGQLIAPPEQNQSEALRQVQEEIQALTAQVERLKRMNRDLSNANQELTAANLELYQANEEYLVNTEEVQAAAEEVETLNEELQATNEELETLNEELQATNEELNATNDDLEARSIELQELAAAYEEQRRAAELERAQLVAILVSMSDAVLVVDHGGKPLLHNAAYSSIFGDPEMPFEPMDQYGQPLPADQTPQQQAARGEIFSMTFTLQTPDGGRRWFEANGRPLQNNGAGVVVIRDITERSLRRLQDEFLALASHELRTPLTSIFAAMQMQMGSLQANSDIERVRRLNEVALRQSQRLIALVSDLTDLSRLQTGKLHLQMKTINLTDVITEAIEAVRVLSPEKQITLVAPTKPLMVWGDPVRIEQIALNLLSNALRYAPESS